jgi:hypothetical protein
LELYNLKRMKIQSKYKLINYKKSIGIRWRT